MSFFGVTLEKISNIRPIEGADKIELASLEGSTFQFVIGKDSFKAGDQVLYFPVDSILQESTIAAIGLTGKLSGNQKNRVKTVKLRGQFSQGVVANTSVLAGLLSTNPSPSPEEITAYLGVTKYDPETAGLNGFNKNVNLHPLPGTQVYDIEGIDRYPDLVAKLMDVSVVITEKLEGSHASFTIKKTVDGLKFYVCQRRHSLEPKEGVKHSYWEVADRLHIKDGLERLLGALGADVVTLRGEMVGPRIQGNHYKWPVANVFAFDIEYSNDGDFYTKFVNASGLNATLATYFPEVEPVPTLAHGYSLRAVLDMEKKTLVEYADGPSVFSPKGGYLAREGIVIKPEFEMYEEGFGRIILKKRGPKYLEKFDT